METPISKIAALLALMACMRVAVGATAIAPVSATISEAASEVGGLVLTPQQLDMHGRSNGFLTLMNHSSRWREVDVELAGPSASSEGCELRYSPRHTRIPPGGHQVLRLLFRPGQSQHCDVNYQLVIRDLVDPEEALFTVPVYTAVE